MTREVFGWVLLAPVLVLAFVVVVPVAFVLTGVVMGVWEWVDSR
ncbi:MAG: hypothetical protein WCF36_18975 [Candidatus Nanopelagicales bacterium]